MKLKKAILIAKGLGYKYIAVNIYKKIYAYKNNPFSYIGSDNKYKYIGMYTGKKHWLNTVKKV